MTKNPALSVLRIAVLILILSCFFLMTWFVRHEDLFFVSDIARDFFLFGEIDVKKIIFIGPRSSAGGLFHGPLWIYLNYPAYVIGQGNPVIVGWYWLFLIGLFLWSCYYVGKKLFSEQTGLLFSVLMASYLILDAAKLYNPFGAFFLMPLTIYTFVRFLQTKNSRFLIGHAFLLGCIIHFQMAVGIPLLMLSGGFILMYCLRNRSLTPILSYLILLVVLSNYIIFDIRHDFLMLKGIIHNASPEAANPLITWKDILMDRITYILNPQLLRAGDPNSNLLLAGFIALLFGIQIRDKRYVTTYLVILYFYGGFLLFSLLSRNILLLSQFLPLIPLIFLLFSSFITSRLKVVLLAVCAIVFLTNLNTGMLVIKAAPTFSGNSPESWRFLHEMSEKVVTSSQPFGYFVYSPDAFGYQPKYAMRYSERLHPEKATYLQKKEITYLISAPPPPDNPYMLDVWWIETMLKIPNASQSAQLVIKYPNGYEVKRFTLSPEEQQVSPDANIDVGLSFR